MSELKLKMAVHAANNLIEERKKQFFRQRRELDNTETLLVEAREAKRHAEEELYEYTRTQIGDFSLDEARNKQVEDFRSRLDASMKKIENEAPLPFKMMSDLGTVEAWAKSRYHNEIDGNLDD